MNFTELIPFVCVSSFCARGNIFFGSSRIISWLFLFLTFFLHWMGCGVGRLWGLLVQAFLFPPGYVSGVLSPFQDCLFGLLPFGLLSSPLSPPSASSVRAFSSLLVSLTSQRNLIRRIPLGKNLPKTHFVCFLGLFQNKLYQEVILIFCNNFMGVLVLPICLSCCLRSLCRPLLLTVEQGESTYWLNQPFLVFF